MKYKVPFVNPSLHYFQKRKEILKTIDNTLKRGDLILRNDVDSFEKKIASLSGRRYAIALNSGTDALYFSLIAAGIGSGDEVVTVSHTFVATISSIVHTGAEPILVDVGDDYLIDPEGIEKVITKKTRVIIPVHLNGRICQMDKIMGIAKRHKLIVIEDAAQALGAKFKSRPAGSFGLTGCFSFYPFKLLGGLGDGGAMVTDNKNIATKIRLLRNHCQKTKTKIICHGFNSRLDNLNAAVLNKKIKHLDSWIKRRRSLARMYQKGLSDVKEIKLPPHPDNDKEHFDVYQNYVIRAKKRDRLFKFLEDRGIETMIKDPIPNHWQKGLRLSHFHLPHTERLSTEIISLPLYPELTDLQIKYVIDCICKFYRR